MNLLEQRQRVRIKKKAKNVSSLCRNNEKYDGYMSSSNAPQILVTEADPDLAILKMLE